MHFLISTIGHKEIEVKAFFDLRLGYKMVIELVVSMDSQWVIPMIKMISIRYQVEFNKLNP